MRVRSTKPMIVMVATVLLLATAPAYSQAARLDSTFGEAGTAAFSHEGPAPLGPFVDEYAGQAFAVDIQEDGKILVGGGSGNQFLVIRVLPNGSLDPSFGDGGAVRFEDPNTPGSASMAPQIASLLQTTNEKILVLGETRNMAGPFPDGNAREVLVRLNSDGTMDSSFGRNNFEKGPVGSSIPRTLIKSGDASFLTAGSFVSGRDFTGFPTAYSGYLSKRNGDGSLDAEFGAEEFTNYSGYEGVLSYPPGGQPRYSAVSDLAVRANGMILAAGHDRNRLFLTRVRESGRPDLSFGRSLGRTVLSFGGKKCFCVAGGQATFLKNGRTLQVGYSSYPTKKRISTLVLAKYLKSGKPDRSFGNKGLAHIRFRSWIRSTSIATQANGRILVSGRLGPADLSKFMLARFLPNGKLDKAFFRNGIYLDPTGKASSAEDVIIDGKGRAIVVGGYSQGGTGHFMIKRFRLQE